MQSPTSEPLPVLDFRSAARATLKLLQQRCAMTLWMLARAEGDDDDWIVLDAEDRGYGLKQGDILHWSKSACSRLMKGQGPRCVPDLNQLLCAEPRAEPAADEGDAPVVASYIGVPLVYGDGSLFGTLCAISPTPQSPQLINDLPMIELMASMLSALLVAELRVSVESRSADNARSLATRDELTGLFNRRGWDEILALEESRCERYGSPACVFSIDLDSFKDINDTQGHDAGDEYLRAAARVLAQASRASDLIARVGGDEFAILAVEANPAAGELLAYRLREAFAAAGVGASLGFVPRSGTSLQTTWKLADEAMYDDKRSRRAVRVPA